MPVRATKRGADRTPLDGTVDVLVCGASFAGLAVARELRGSGADVLVLDRYEIGERQTSACAAPTRWLENLDLHGSIRQTFGSLVAHTPGRVVRWPLPYTFSTFDYRTLCAELWAQCGAARFETAKVERATHPADPDGLVEVHTDRGTLRARLVVDALGWRRVLGSGPAVQPPHARLSRGLEVHPAVPGPPAPPHADLELWIDRRITPIGYGWSFPARDELRIGIGSFDPHHHVKEETNALSREVGPEPAGYQGNWIPHRIRPGVEGPVFFVGDSAGHCIPLSAEGIRTAFYFGIACGRELREVLAGARSRAAALERYGGFTRRHDWKFEAMLRVQQLIPRLPPRVLSRVSGLVRRERVAHWLFGHYGRIAPPEAALPAPPSP